MRSESHVSPSSRIHVLDAAPTVAVRAALVHAFAHAKRASGACNGSASFGKVSGSGYRFCEGCTVGAVLTVSGLKSQLNITSNLATHAWSIKYRQKKLIARFS